MAERLILVDKERLEYEGLFDAKEFYRVMQAWAEDKGYWLIEGKHTESIKTEGKWVDMEFAPFKKFTDYAKSVIKIKVQYQRMKDVVVERDGKKHKMQEGKVVALLDGILETDYEHRWETKPVYYVLRTLFEKYVFTPFVSGFEQTVKNDTYALKDNMKAFLNMSKYA